MGFGMSKNGTGTDTHVRSRLALEDVHGTAQHCTLSLHRTIDTFDALSVFTHTDTRKCLRVFHSSFHRSKITAPSVFITFSVQSQQNIGGVGSVDDPPSLGAVRGGAFQGRDNTK